MCWLHPKKLLIYFLLFATIVLAIVLAADVLVGREVKNTYSDIAAVPENKVGLVLGTSKYGPGGGPNLFFLYRIQAAQELFAAGKVKYLVISGDNSTVSHNEPRDMKAALVKLGVPEDKIFLDYAGFNTYDSVVRVNAIFEQTTFTIISQQFHNERALYIARHKGFAAVGFNAQAVPTAASWKTLLREKIARVKAIFDVAKNRQPKFLGETITIP